MIVDVAVCKILTAPAELADVFARTSIARL